MNVTRSRPTARRAPHNVCPVCAGGPRLRFAAALSVRAIARSLRASPSMVGDYVRRAEVGGLGWPVPESVDDATLERRLFPTPPPSGTSRPLPAWSEVHQELRRTGRAVGAPRSRQTCEHRML